MPTPTVLSTIDSVKLKLGITGAASDALLQQYVTAACQTVESWLGRIIGSNTYTKVLNGNGHRSAFLGQFPITAVSAVVVDGVSIPADPAATGYGYVFDELAIYLRGCAFSKGVQNISITYTAGYATIPTDISESVDEIVILNYNRRSHVDTSSKSLAGETVSYIQADMPKSAMSRLNNYKLVVPV